MNVFSRLVGMIRQVIHRMIPYKSIEQVERVDTTLSTEMASALDRWHEMYLDRAPWLGSDTVKSLNLPAFISSEISRQVVLEMKWNITGKDRTGMTKDGDGGDIMNPRAQYLKDEFEKLTHILRQKLEQGLAAGGMIIKPYVNPQDGHIYFDWVMDWGLYPLAFDDDGNLADVILPDIYTEGKVTYTRLERHTVVGRDVKITQRAFKSNQKDMIGTEIPLSEVPRWAHLQPEVTVQNTEGPLFGWFKVASANNVDVDSPLGASVFSKAEKVIEQADKQYSRLLWEFEGGELAVDVDPSVLRPKSTGRTNADGTPIMETPKLNQRLFRQVDADKGDRDLYEVFSPALRDSSLTSGLNTLLKRVEDLSGLSRGTLSDANVDARTATELKIIKQRSYATVSDNQTMLEVCLKSVIRVMDKYASIYNLAPEGEYDVSFDWDDSILTDSDTQMNEFMMLRNAGIVGKAEFRMWYFGETKAQAEAAIASITDESIEGMRALNSDLPQIDDETAPEGTPDGRTVQKVQTGLGVTADERRADREASEQANG